MKRSDNQYKFDALRQQFSTFTFDSQEIELKDGALHLAFFFNLDGKYHFTPTLTIPARPFYHWDMFPEEQLQTLAFHIGMIELVSYWKIACPKKVIVKPFSLTERQKSFWKKLYYNGLGEFFYLNTITCSETDFMTIETPEDKPFAKVNLPLQEKAIIPVGGGKDSVVTLELLRNELPCTPLIVNPRGATLGCVETAGYADGAFMVANRTLDPVMLQLNKEGYLNGHTPFSAMLAFVTILLGFGSGCRYIALSNESSANESTVPGTNINHQYSKSVEFERDFREYVAENINADIQYFSFLRPLSEMQIAYFFAQFEAYHKVFRSCNAGSKTDSWCGNCPKCLFTWLILSPFISREKLTEIFGKDLMADMSLRPIFEELNGTSAVKPFECVGTVEEVKACVDAMQNREGTIAAVSPKAETNVAEMLKRYNEENFLPDKIAAILKSKLYV
ncbi:MAG: hypothetical protein MJZ97_09720 [Bacteroidales bacterium]|nr:hypothetical protein [Bacteroidales bacterium]